MKIIIKDNGDTTVIPTNKNDREYLKKWLQSKGFKNIKV